MRIEDANTSQMKTSYQSHGTCSNRPDAKDAHIKSDSPEMDKALRKKGEHSAEEAAVIEAIEKANKAIFNSNRILEYSIHEKTKEIMVKVIDSETKEVIREIPSEKILDLVAKLCENAGILVDERR